MREVHGNLSAKLSPFEWAELGIVAAERAHELFAASGGGHAGAGEFEPLLAVPMPEAKQRLCRIAQVVSEAEFERFCDDLADYGAAISDTLKRKRIGQYLVILGKARGAIEAGQASIVPPPLSQQPPYDQGSYSPQPPPAQQWQPARPLAIEAPHPHEALFKRFMDAGPRGGWQAMRAEVSGLDSASVKRFAQMLREYMTSLRNPEAIKTAVALSNNLAVEYYVRFSNTQATLPAPNR
jgi:hypothetical protein